MKTDYFRVCAEIDLNSIRTNIINIKKGLNAQTKICSVIKADGYGHGAVKVAGALLDLADFFAVATLEEALELREGKIDTPILILGYINPDGFDEAVKNNISLTIFDLESAKLLSDAAIRQNKTAKVHIKIDTGMSRIGFLPDDEALEQIMEIAGLPYIEIEGVFTHLFASDSADKTSALLQIASFENFCNKLSFCDIDIPIAHCANSAAAISMPDANMDMVRLGIAQYGLYPSDEVTELDLIGAMSLNSHVIMVKTVKKGTSVGYGATYTAPKDLRVATIPVGYADGYARSLSNKGFVLIDGQKAPVIGRVCMDQFMVDVSEIKSAKRGSEAVLIGKSKGSIITMEEVARLSGRFNYEFACGISKRVPRKYI